MDLRRFQTQTFNKDYTTASTTQRIQPKGVQIRMIIAFMS